MHLALQLRFAGAVVAVVVVRGGRGRHRLNTGFACHARYCNVRVSGDLHGTRLEPAWSPLGARFGTGGETISKLRATFSKAQVSPRGPCYDRVMRADMYT